MKEYFIGSQGQQETVVLEKEEEEEEKENNDLNKVNATKYREYVREMCDKYGSQGHKVKWHVITMSNNTDVFQVSALKNILHLCDI